MATCAAALAWALGIGIHSPAQTGSTAAVRPVAVRPAAAHPAPVRPVAAHPAPVPTAARSFAQAGGGTGSPGSVPAAHAGATDPELEAAINSIIEANSEYRIGVALLSLSGGAGATGAVRSYGVDEAFVAASTAKVLAAEAFYHLIETGQASLDGPLGDYTAEFQLQAMIQQSDNDSWSLIMDAVGHGELTDYAALMGVEYNPGSNELTPADMARILAGLYSGTLLDPADTAQLLGYMQDTNEESLIPAATPAGITVFHKHGVLDGELHDAGILTRDGTAYALVVFTRGDGLDSVPERTDVIHQVTQAVVAALF